VDRAWVVPTTQALRSLPQDMFWEWAPWGSLPKTSTTAISQDGLVKKVGLPPTRAQKYH